MVEITPKALETLGAEPTLSVGVGGRWPTVRSRQVAINDSNDSEPCPGPADETPASPTYETKGSGSCGSCEPCTSGSSSLCADRLSAIRESAGSDISARLQTVLTLSPKVGLVVGHSGLCVYVWVYSGVAG